MSSAASKDRSSGLRLELCVRKSCTAQWYMVMMKSYTVVYEQNDAANVLISLQDAGPLLRAQAGALR